MDSNHPRDLYPHIEPYHSSMLDVGDGHSIYFETSANADGIPVVFLHGGPGAGVMPTGRRFFNPEHYRIILFDQRGAGKSTPRASLEHNSTWHLVDDMEKLRRHLGVDRWLVFGGSWGSTLALAYGQRYPERCLGFILRGIFLGEKEEIDWFLGSMGTFYPEAWEKFSTHPGVDPQTLLDDYSRLLDDPDPGVHLPAARAWAGYETVCSTLLPGAYPAPGGAFDFYALSLARIEAHYFRNAMFLEPGQLLAGMGRISHLPAHIIHGRHDVICRPVTAGRLAAGWPGARLEIINDAGHSAMEPGIRRALARAADDFLRNPA